MISTNLQGKPTFTAAKYNIVFDGNSLIYGQGATYTQFIAGQLTLSKLLNGSGITCRSFGIPGQTWGDMIANHADVDAAFVPGKRNILFCWEGTNAIFNSARTGIVAAQDAGRYAQAMKAVNPSWEIIVMSTIPGRYTSSLGVTNFGSVDAVNRQVDIHNLYLQQNLKSLGFDGYLDLRCDGSPYAFKNYTDADFTARNAYYLASEQLTGTGVYVHQQDAGYQVVADLVQQYLRRIGRA